MDHHLNSIAKPRPELEANKDTFVGKTIVL